MKRRRSIIPRLLRPRRPRAFTIAEVSVCVVIVGVMLVAALQTVGQSATVQQRIATRTRGSQLARAMLAEVMQQNYVEPSVTPVFGPEGGETRATYDDVDDYNGLIDSTSVGKDGSSLAVPSASLWKRTVAVEWADPLTLKAVAPQLETGVKLITVTVQYKNVVVTKAQALRTSAP